jgi:hypothetical protein
VVCSSYYRASSAWPSVHPVPLLRSSLAHISPLSCRSPVSVLPQSCLYPASLLPLFCPSPAPRLHLFSPLLHLSCPSPTSVLFLDFSAHPAPAHPASVQGAPWFPRVQTRAAPSRPSPTSSARPPAQKKPKTPLVATAQRHRKSRSRPIHPSARACSSHPPGGNAAMRGSRWG